MQLYMGRGETQMEEASDMEFCLSPSLFPQNIWSVLATYQNWMVSFLLYAIIKKEISSKFWVTDREWRTYSS